MINFIDNKNKTAKVLLIFIMLFSIVIMLLAVFFIPEKSNRFIYMGTSTSVVALILLIMMPKIRLKLLNYLLVFFLFILFTISSYTTVGVHSPSYIGGYLICSFISGLLISPRVGWIVSLISIFSGFILTILELKGFMPMHNALEATGVFIASITFFIINILIQYFYANNIKLSFQRFNSELKERKEVERVLRKNEEWLNLVFENINDGIWDLNVLTNDIILSPNYYTMLGYNIQEINTKFSSYRNLVHHNDLSIFDTSFDNCLNGLSDKINIEVRMKTKEGTWKCLLLKGKVLEKNLNNQVLRIVGSHTDITEIKNYQDALKLSEERYKIVTSNIPNSAVILFDNELRFLLVDGTEIPKSGYSKSDIEGKTPRESLPLDFAIIAEQNMTRVLNGEVFSAELPFNDIWFLYNYVPLKNDDGEVLYGMILAQNITMRKNFEQELKMLNETLESKVEQRTLELTEINIKLNETLQNLKDAQEQIIISEKMAALGQLIASIAHELNTPLGAIKSSVKFIDDTVIESFKILLTNYSQLENNKKVIFHNLLDLCYVNYSNILVFEDRKKKKDLIKVANQFFPDKSEHIIDMLLEIGFNEDENYLIKILEIDGIEEIIQNIHFISSILRSIKVIDTASSKASKVVTALKTYSHHDELEELVVTDVVEGIELVLTIYFSKIKNNINLTKKYDLYPKIMSYPERLNQVWVNLINNSLHAMNFSGDLKIEVKKQDNLILVSFTDNGVGIPENMKDKVFNPFFTTKMKGEGSGLGLDICKNILEQIGGNIVFESKNNQTTFIVFLKELK